MTLLRHGGRIIYFAHIPKTGGSSIEGALRSAGAERALHFHRTLGYAQANLQHMHASLYEKLVPPSFYDYGLAVTRHPFDRLLSEYKWRIQLGHVQEEFDHWVNRLLKTFESKPYILDNHIRPQHQFVGSKIAVFRFEDGLQRPLQVASEHLGLEAVDFSTHIRAGDQIQVEWSNPTYVRALEFYRTDFETFGYDPADVTDDIQLA